MARRHVSGRLAAGLWIVGLAFGPVALAEQVDFNRQLRPLLADHCYACHGPDAGSRQADLRLDIPEGALGDRGGHAAFVPGDPQASEAIRRILSADPDVMMPPPAAKLALREDQKQMLVEWVRQGAHWEDHWAFCPPDPQRPPELDAEDWPKNDIDRFVLARLKEESLKPSPPADKATLLRRVTLDLTGLPPTPAEYASSLSDSAPNAYANAVDRLLASDACAERLALQWLDVARYADSHGLHADGARRSWPWRDWVIRAFRDNMPYDQFVTWQLAGDLLPGASKEQRLATAFLRMHPMTAEGGVIDEEWRWNYVFDRTETTATALLGLTLECARCHDHKFDPLSQREYYQFAAFFNNVDELGMTGDDGDYGPLLMMTTADEDSKLAALDREIAAAENQLDQVRSEAAARFADHTASKTSFALRQAELRPTPLFHFPLESVKSVDEDPESPYRIDGNDSFRADLPPMLRPGVLNSAAFIQGEYGFLKLKNVRQPDVADALSAAIWIYPERVSTGEGATTRVILGNAGNKNQFWRGWEFFIDRDGHLALTLAHQPPDNRIHIRTEELVPNDKWTHVAFSYDGCGKAAGARLFINGKRANTMVLADSLTRTMFPAKTVAGYPPDPDRELRIGRSHRAFTGDFGIYRGGLDELLLFDQPLTDVEVAALYDSYASRPAGETPSISNQQRFEHWLERSYEPWANALHSHRQLVAQRVELLSSVPVIMVMEEMDQPRPCHVLQRGLYDQPAEPVACGTPSAVLPFEPELPANRAGLARWLFDERNPLTARVAVNRYWQMLFGQGLVSTAHDFGTQGDRPSHPELLDWLAIRLRESGWNIREMLRLMVTSATYQQSSSIAEWCQHRGPAVADAPRIDPGNRLCWRGPSQRLSAEAIRDSALSASGLLVRKVGGPSAKPYNPDDLWIEKNNFSQELMHYVEDKGDGLYRRSMYTFIRRTSPPPAMELFDAPTRSRCTMKREVTNTPLQALVLLNDPTFVESARVLAEDILRTADSDDDCIGKVFASLTGRPPSGSERESLEELYHGCRRRFAADSGAAAALLEVGEKSPDESLNPIDVAALTMVANTVMNYDAFYMKR